MKYSHLKKMVVFIVLSCLVSACAAQRQTLHQPDLVTAYGMAVKDAEKAEPSEIYKNLVAIVPSNTHLVFKNKEDCQRASLLVVTWTNYDGYDDKIGQSVDLQKEVWVTTVPELRNFCKKLSGNKTLRLEQLLGLPPNAGKTKFVEMWVKPGDLFRPSADPEITDSESEIDFRIWDAFVTVSDDYVNWFNDRKMKSYATNGYPWTRLGYTYDWGNDGGHVGLSEFVIKKGAAVEIYSVSSELQYCR